MTIASVDPDSSIAPGAALPSGPIGLCLTCNYPLWGLATPRCPECGREFDPLNPATMNMGRELTPLAKWLLGPIRWPVNVLTWSAVGFALWSARLPGRGVMAIEPMAILIGLSALWLTWPVVRAAVARHYGWPHSLLMRGQRQRIAVGIFLLLSIVAILRDVPMRAAFWISKPALDRLALDSMQSTTPYLDDRWAGLFNATRVKQVPGGMRFTAEEHNRAFKSGFTYLPKVDPKRVGWSARSYRYMGGGWWAWREEG